MQKSGSDLMNLSSITVAFVIEPKLEHAVHKLTAESFFVPEVPLSVDDLEGDVFVWRTRLDAEHAKLRVFYNLSH